jgi:bacteriocin-like protein
MFNFSKKNAEIEEQVMEEVTDEQLNQVTGGSLLSAVSVGGLLGSASGVTGFASQEVSSIGLSGLNVSAGGINISVPSIAPATLLP